MYIQKFRLVVPADMNLETAAIASAMQEHDKVQVFQGDQAVSNYGVTVQGSGAWAQGSIQGKMSGFDYKALYDVYSLKDSEAADYWFVTYRKQTSHDQLVKTFEQARSVDLKYDLKFMIQGNDYGISSVFITYEVIRLVYQGQTKDFVVTNDASAGAIMPDGNKYPGGFKPIE